MLIFTRKANESVVINDDIEITILQTGSTIRLGICAPESVVVHRAEVKQRITGAVSEKSPKKKTNNAEGKRSINET